MADNIEIELDDTTPERRAAAAGIFDSERRPIELAVNPDDGCIECGGKVPLSIEGVCERCHPAFTIRTRAAARKSAMSPAHAGIVAAGGGTPAEQGVLAAIAEQSRAVGERTMLSPSSRGSVDATPHHEDTHASDDAIAAMRARAAEQRERDRLANETAAVARRAEAEEQRIAEEQRRLERRPTMRGGDVVAGAAAEGNGVLVGWRGKGDMTRAAIVAMLERAGLPAEWAPEVVEPEAQASRSLATLKPEGYRVKPEKRGKRQTVEAREYEARWIVDAPNEGARVGDRAGDVVLVATLYGDQLEFDGDMALAERVVTEYDRRTGESICKASDITARLQNLLVEKMDAVRYGVGWYVPRSHAATAGALCETFEKAGWGDPDSWVSPALPIATGDQLRAGILKGLAAEVRVVLEQVSKEREIARTKEDRDDIGPKRAATFLSNLKAVGRRVVGYGVLLGADRVESLRSMIADAISVLETSLSEEDRAIVTRFDNIWSEIEMERQRGGGVL